MSTRLRLVTAVRIQLANVGGRRYRSIEFYSVRKPLYLGNLTFREGRMPMLKLLSFRPSSGCFEWAGSGATELKRVLRYRD